jgi:hypothetical protein
VEKEEEGKGKRRERATALTEQEDGYYTSGTSPRRVSTFIIEPKILLDGSAFDHEDAIIGDVHANGQVWPDRTFTRSAFTSAVRLFKECLVADWQWLGSDTDVRLLLPHLIQKLEERSVLRVKASPTLGLHTIGTETYFLGDAQTLSKDGLWSSPTGPLTWLPRHREHWRMDLEPLLEDSDLRIFREYLPQLNSPANIWTVLGWYGASMLKPWLKERGWRFPILHLTGTKGSGKTSILLYVMHRLFGQTDPKSYDAGTTKFVTLSLMGGSNAVPVVFSEFRYESVERFQRFILLAYDTGHDPRGRADQSLVDYPLSAPFSIDGEDMLADPAVQERIVVARFHPAEVARGTPAFDAYQRLQLRLNPHERQEAGLPKLGFAGYYLQHVLQLVHSGDAARMLSTARSDMARMYPQQLPERVRNNYTIVAFGMRLVCSALGLTVPGVEVLSDGVRMLVNLESGRSRMQCDDFVEDVVNFINDSPSVSSNFKWYYDTSKNAVYFHLKSAHTWWLVQRRRQGRSGLELDAIKAQLKETKYALDPIGHEGAWLHGISVTDSRSEGVDIPEKLPDIKEMRIRGL